MNQKPIITIDPGQSGGIAWTDRDGQTYAEKMPDGMTAQADTLRSIVATLPGAECVLEKVGTYVKGNAVGGACKFARHCGHMESILYMLGVPTRQVAPAVWQKAMGAMPKDKPERKRAIRELMARRFPSLTVTLATADALGIMVWAGQEDVT